MRKITALSDRYLKTIAGGNTSQASNEPNRFEIDKQKQPPQPSISIQGSGNERYIQGTVSATIHTTPNTQVVGWLGGDSERGPRAGGVNIAYSW